MQEAAVYDPLLLFSANLKRDLAEEQPYRRALRELGLSSVWVPGRREAKNLGHRLAGYLVGAGGGGLAGTPGLQHPRGSFQARAREPSAA